MNKTYDYFIKEKIKSIDYVAEAHFEIKDDILYIICDTYPSIAFPFKIVFKEEKYDILLIAASTALDTNIMLYMENIKQLEILKSYQKK